MKKKNIGVLITIIILLIIFVPSAIYGTYMHFKIDAMGGNVNKNFYYEGKLYFYDRDSLLGTYICKSENCGYATNYIEENQNFEMFNNNASEIKAINNHFVFIKDGENVLLYDIVKQTKLIDYKAIKNYTVGISNNCFIVKNTSDKWGMICVDDNINVTIPFNYNYLGIKNNLNANGQIDSSKIVAKTDQEWRIISNNNNIVVTDPNQIHDYTESIVVTKENINMNLKDYNNNAILDNYKLVDVKILENIIVATTNNNSFYLIYNINTKSIIKTIAINNNGEYFFEIINNSLVISQNDQVIDTIALN